MAKVNYIREVEGFQDWAEANRLCPSERLVWQALFHLFNARAFDGDWPEGYIDIKTRELTASTGLSRMTVTRAREKLARRGLLDFIPGFGENATCYKMCWLSLDGAPAAPVESHDFATIGAVDNLGGSAQIEQGSAQNEQRSAQIGQGECSNWAVPEYCTSIDTPVNFSKQEEEDIYNNNQVGRAREIMYIQAIGETYREAVGRAPSAQEARDIAEIAAWNRAEPALVREAIRRGASANYPGKYAAKCLMSWGDMGLSTVEELTTYERYVDLSKTARPDIAQRGEELLRSFLTEIKIKHRMVHAV